MQQEDLEFLMKDPIGMSYQITLGLIKTKETMPVKCLKFRKRKNKKLKK